MSGFCGAAGSWILSAQTASQLSHLPFAFLLPTCGMNPTRTQNTPTSATPAAHAMGMPEIAFQISFYLAPADVFSCHSVSRSLRLAFGPFVWQDLHFGKPCQINRYESPFARHLAIQDDDPIALDILRRAALWTDSLSIRSHESILPLRLGELCSGLKRIDLEGLCYDQSMKHPAEYWKCCQAMFQQSQGRLRSLVLRNWMLVWDHEFELSRPLWNPLVGIVDCTSLRSLTLKHCEIGERYMAHFWRVGRQLETLQLDGVRMDLDIPLGGPTRPSRNATPAHSTMSNVTPVHESRLPRLQELILRDMTDIDTFDASQVLGLLVVQCPALKTLHWTLRGFFPHSKFSMLFCTMTWPGLNSITVKGNTNRISDECYSTFLTDPRRHPHHRPLRRLKTLKPIMSMTEFNLYRRHHFGTLESIDIYYTKDHTTAWTIQIMASCPSLQRFKSRIITTREIIDSGPSWVCHRLQKLSIMIDMGLQSDRDPCREFTEQELDQCRAMYKQLATLKRLRVLDTFLWKRRSTCSLMHSHLIPHFFKYKVIPPPMRLKAGLDELSQLTELQTVRFWSWRHATYEKEVMWMLKHWKYLKDLVGGWLGGQRTPNDMGEQVFFSRTLEQLLTQHRINTQHSRWYTFTSGGQYDLHVEDCCGENE